VIVVALQTAAWAWDPTGHMLVDQIAWTQTKPAARERVTALVAKIDNRFNENRPYNFTTAGCWMDDMRATPDYAYSLWHYVDMPFTPTARRGAHAAAVHALAYTARCEHAVSPGTTTGRASGRLTNDGLQSLLQGVV